MLYAGAYQEPFREDFFSKRPPVYPLLLLPFLTLSHPYLWIALFQTVLSFFNLYLAYTLAVKLSMGKGQPFLRWALLVGAMVYPAQLIYANLIMTEILLQSLVLLSIFPLIMWEGLSSKKTVAIFSLGITLAMLTKPVMYLFVFPYFLWGVGHAIQKKQPSLWALYLIPLFTFLGYSGYQAQKTGYFHFSSIQVLSLYQYTTQNLLVQELGEARATALTDSVLEVGLALPTYQAQQQYFQAFGLQTLKKYPLSYASMHLKGILNFFLDPGRFDLYHFWGLEASGDGGLLTAFSQDGYRGIWAYLSTQNLWIVGTLMLLLLFRGILLVGTVAFVFLPNVSWTHKGWLLMFVVYLSVLTGTSGASRFAVPVFPLMWVMAICSILQLFRPKPLQPGERTLP